jgi:hypothetical protein
MRIAAERRGMHPSPTYPLALENSTKKSNRRRKVNEMKSMAKQSLKIPKGVVRNTTTTPLIKARSTA